MPANAAAARPDLGMAAPPSRGGGAHGSRRGNTAPGRRAGAWPASPGAGAQPALLRPASCSGGAWARRLPESLQSSFAEPLPMEKTTSTATGFDGGFSKFSASSSMRGSRFTVEEMNSMRRQVSPSSECREKAEAYWQTVGGIRETMGGKSLHTLPVLKGKFFNHPKVKASLIPSTVKRTENGKTGLGFLDAEAEPLPMEPMTAVVLEGGIYPRVLSPDSRSRPSATSAASASPGSPAPDGLAPSTRDGGKSLAFAPLQEKASPTSLPSNKDKPRSWQRTSTQQQLPRAAAGSPGGPLQPPSRGLAPTSSRCSPPPGRSRSPATRRRRSGWMPPAPTGRTSLGSALLPGRRRPRPPRPPWRRRPRPGQPGLGTTAGAVTLTTLHALRLQIKERFGSVAEAFERFAEDVPLTRAPTRKEWLRLLGKHGFDWFTKARMDSVFDQLDKDRDGYVSVTELRIAIEATAPVRTTASLRRRWLAFGFSSMVQAAARMDDNGQDPRAGSGSP
ncbi:unnamed protein product [Prorocentrum cordatum]|uniref:EF-hand domain-containing protein n=1 Tax=Prorocentrum cordatum TaxID=2364126 RepID=A0ABN9S746_9DINO|nr:unnamed protein product [Polarella glacialis]